MTKPMHGENRIEDVEIDGWVVKGQQTWVSAYSVDLSAYLDEGGKTLEIECGDDDTRCDVPLTVIDEMRRRQHVHRYPYGPVYESLEKA